MSVCLRHTPCIGSTFTSYALRSVTRFPTLAVRPYSTPADSQDDPIDDSFIPTPIDRSYETPDVTRARLVYQSRKRGILETDLVLSTFADKFLPTMSPEELKEYDKLLDEPDWEIYYWATEKKPIPPEWKDSKILATLKKHVKNEGKVILRMPDLNGP